MSKKPPLPHKTTALSDPPLVSAGELVAQIEQLARATTAVQSKTDAPPTRWEHTFKFVHASAEEEPTVGRLQSTAGFLEPDGWELVAVAPHEMRIPAGMIRGWMTFWKRRKQ